MCVCFGLVCDVVMVLKNRTYPTYDADIRHFHLLCDYSKKEVNVMKFTGGGRKFINFFLQFLYCLHVIMTYVCVLVGCSWWTIASENNNVCVRPCTA